MLKIFIFLLLLYLFIYFIIEEKEKKIKIIFIYALNRYFSDLYLLTHYYFFFSESSTTHEKKKKINIYDKHILIYFTPLPSFFTFNEKWRYFPDLKI